MPQFEYSYRIFLNIFAETLNNFCRYFYRALHSFLLNFYIYLLLCFFVKLIYSKMYNISKAFYNTFFYMYIHIFFVSRIE